MFKLDKMIYWLCKTFDAWPGFTLILDLVSKEIVEKWIKYLRNEFPTVAFKASTQQQTKNLVYCYIIYIYI